MKKNNVEFIPNHKQSMCWVCEGKGIIEEKCERKNLKMGTKLSICKTCKGTGKFTETHYYLIVGKIAFGVDSLK